MLKKFITVFVSLLVSLLILCAPTSVGAQTAEDTNLAAKIKQHVAALGDGARVSVKLRDKKRMTGHINYVGDDSFTLTDVKTQASHTLAYSDVAQIERSDRGFSKKAKVAIGILGAAFVVGMIANGGG